jgi:hypothetical protein
VEFLEDLTLNTSKKLQQGATFWEISMYVFVFLFVVTAVLKLGPMYMEDKNITQAFKGVHEGFAGQDIYELTNAAIKGRINKFFQVSMISPQIEKQVRIERENGGVFIRLDYETRMPFMGNIDIVLSFSHEENLVDPVEK